jgi:hypothetical protein
MLTQEQAVEVKVLARRGTECARAHAKLDCRVTRCVAISERTRSRADGSGDDAPLSSIRS